MTHELDQRPASGTTAFEWGAIEDEAVRRVGVVDVGSNSVRLVVFDGVARSPAYFYNEKVLCGLGAGIHETGCLNPEGRKRAMVALHRFVALAKLMRIGGLTAVATAAVREASDGPAFCTEVLEQTGLKLHVAAGEEEARLSAQGVLLGWPHADGIVCDIGGASMELARVREGVIAECATSPLGPLQLANIPGGTPAIDAEIAALLSALRQVVPGKVRKLYLVGGSWRAIARLDMERRKYPLKVLHEYRLTPEELMKTALWVRDKRPEDLSHMTETSQQRLDLVPLAARVLSQLLEVLQPGLIAVSSYGLREGMLYELMPDALRAKDPLLEAAWHAEQANARFPGFGDTLFQWLMPLYEGVPSDQLRLINAACRLHDITWRTHPDYRAEVCFEAVTRANLSGIDHQGRVFLGHAILHRYKSGGRSLFEESLIGMLEEGRVKDAEILGRAMRLGAMLSGAVAGGLENTSLSEQGGELVLTLNGDARELIGEVVERRLASLASRMGCTGRVVLNAAD